MAAICDFETSKGQRVALEPFPHAPLCTIRVASGRGVLELAQARLLRDALTAFIERRDPAALAGRLGSAITAAVLLCLGVRV